MAKDKVNAGQKDNLLACIKSLALHPEQQKYLEVRWLDQLVWMGDKAKRCQNSYYLLRIVAMVGGVIVPALGVLAKNSDSARNGVVVIGILVALATALEEFFKFGDRWRHYRRITESLKKEWWLYYELCGNYAGKEHEAVFSGFVTRIEDMLAADVDRFLTSVAVDMKPKAPVAGGKVGS